MAAHSRRDIGLGGVGRLQDRHVSLESAGGVVDLGVEKRAANGAILADGCAGGDGFGFGGVWC